MSLAILCNEESNLRLPFSRKNECVFGLYLLQIIELNIQSAAEPWLLEKILLIFHFAIQLILFKTFSAFQNKCPSGM